MVVGGKIEKYTFSQGKVLSYHSSETETGTDLLPGNAQIAHDQSILLSFHTE